MGTDEHNPAWLVDTEGRVIVFLVQSTAELVRDRLYSGEEEIIVLPFDNSTKSVNAEFEERYLKLWRTQ